MRRRRYATREELIELLAGRSPDIDWTTVVVVLAEIGVPVDHLVKVEVDEEV
jgi:hypothetical protein